MVKYNLRAGNKLTAYGRGMQTLAHTAYVPSSSLQLLGLEGLLRSKQRIFMPSLISFVRFESKKMSPHLVAV
jgi:hypothetical protein